MEALYFVIFFAIVSAIVLIVGFIGNRVVDGTHNALTKHRANKRKTDPRDEAESESLALRYRLEHGKAYWNDRRH